MFNKKYKKRYFKFLNKLEVMLDDKKIDDKTKVMIFKNWIHVEKIMEELEEYFK